ncbi:MAG: OsmC family protein, partial [Chitinophagaceae bacterium]
MKKIHHYQTSIVWTGNSGTGTDGYTKYDRSYTIQSIHKPIIHGSSDAAFRGDVTKYNPEDLLVASLASCHMLWYLHLCAVAGVIVVAYSDNAVGTMIETDNGGGRFSEVILHPTITIKDTSMQEQAILLHNKAHELCFIA